MPGVTAHQGGLSFGLYSTLYYFDLKELTLVKEGDTLKKCEATAAQL